MSAQSCLCRCRHNHDLRHTGNQFAANSGAGLRDLMARMGHDSERAAMIYQREARGAGADKTITDAIDKHVDDEKRQDDGEDSAAAGWLTRSATERRGFVGCTMSLRLSCTDASEFDRNYRHSASMREY